LVSGLNLTAAIRRRAKARVLGSTEDAAQQLS
jgi:hypothetical protein